MNYHVLIDVGGTGIKAAWCDEALRITPARIYPARADEEKGALLGHFAGIIRATCDAVPRADKRLESVRMAFPGPFDYVNGVPLLKGLAKYESLYGVSLPAALGEGRGVKWLFMNDVEAFALGAIAACGLTGRALFLCLGTGAGSAFSVGGRLSTDEAEGIPENGWVYPMPFLGGRIDDHLSARGLTALGMAQTGEALTPLALSRHPAGRTVYEAFGARLLAAMRPIIERFRPDAVVLGGGIARAGELFTAPLADFLCGAHIALHVANDTSGLIFQGLAGRLTHGD